MKEFNHYNPKLLAWLTIFLQKWSRNTGKVLTAPCRQICGNEVDIEHDESKRKDLKLCQIEKWN